MTHIKIEEFLDSNWSIFRADRNYANIYVSRGFGVLIAIHNSLPSEVGSTNITNFSFECKFAKVLIGKHYFYSGIVYVPPRSDEAYNVVIDIIPSIPASLHGDDRTIMFSDFNRLNIRFIFDKNDNCLIWC